MTTAELPPLEVGEDNSKTKTQKIRKFQVHHSAQAKGCCMGF